MELDKKALAVTRLVAAIYEWDPRGPSSASDNINRERAVKQLIDSALPSDQSKQNLVNMILAMTLLTSGNVATVRDPSSFNPKKAKRLSTILSPASEYLLKSLGFPYYGMATEKNYADAKKLLPIIGSSSMLESEVYNVFSKSGLPATRPTLAKHIDISPAKAGIGGYDMLHRGLSNVSDAMVIRITNLDKSWDMSRGVSTSRNYASAKGFSMKEGTNHVLFSFDNPTKKGFNALKMSKYGKEEEVVLSGVAQIENYQLTFYAEDADLDSSGSEFSRSSEYALQVTPSMIFVRKGLRPFYMKSDITGQEAHLFIKEAMSGKPFNITGKDGTEATLVCKPKTASIEAFGSIK